MNAIPSFHIIVWMPRNWIRKNYAAVFEILTKHQGTISFPSSGKNKNIGTL